MASPLPNRSIRVAPEHADVIASVLGLLRNGRAEEVRAAVQTLQSGEAAPVGPFRSAQAALDFLLGRIVAAAHPQAVWLFGSRARGDAGPDSDFDLMAIFPDGDGLAAHRSAMADAVTGAGVGVDITACTVADFEAFSETPGSLIQQVHAEGREVYASPDERRRRRAAEEGS